MLTAHKIALNPNHVQATYFAKACGVARFAYNWALAEWQRAYAAGEKTSQLALRRQLNSVKRTQFPWMLEVTKNAPQMAIIQLGKAFQNFFAKRAGYPTFRKKGLHDRFTLTNDQFAVEDSRIRIPNLGWVRMRESLRFIGKIISATISRVADRWFVSIAVDTPENPVPTAHENQAAVGVDLGVSNFATLSTGEIIAGPKAHKNLLHKLRRLSRSVSRKQRGSRNRDKAKKKLATLHYRIRSIRGDALHKLTTTLTQQYSVIGIEDLNVKGMMKNRRLARAIADGGFYEFRRQLQYKSRIQGSVVVVADRWFASSKLCSVCGEKLSELSLSVRSWACPHCATTHDRDINAAKNLEKMAVSSIVSPSPASLGIVYACGAPSGGVVAQAAASHGVMKQESNIIVTYE